ncbi:MAG: DegT/DnrJ/EryC1/StrS family aminotransferase [Bryobacteraceae bacterium]
MRIPNWPEAGEREIELLREVLGSTQWGGFHEIVPRFEHRFADFQHCGYGLAAFNGTVTLEAMFAVLGIGPGDEVIVPAISFVSTATAVSRAGAIPVFVDIEEYSFNIDPDAVRRAITPRTKAILAVHFGGPLCEIEELSAIAAKHGILLLEDAAHAVGSEWNGKRAGSFGLAASFSLQNGKILTAGEGGMLTSNDATFAEKARAFINQGRREGEGFFFHYTLGSNLRITALQAAVLMAQMDRVPEQIARRTRNSKRIREALTDREGLVFQKIPAAVNVHSEYLLCGRIDAGKFGATRDEFHKKVTVAGIPCTPFYPHTLYQNPMYRTVPCRVTPCPNSEAYLGDAFWFPHRVLLADEESIEEIIAVLQS